MNRVAQYTEVSGEKRSTVNSQINNITGSRKCRPALTVFPTSGISIISPVGKSGILET